MNFTLQVDPVMFIETLVLDGNKGMLQILWDLVD